MKDVLVIVFLSFFVSCTGNKKMESSICTNDSLYIIDVDNIAKEDSINYSSYFKSIKPIILETNENCLIGNVNTVRVVDEFIVVTDLEKSGGVFVFDKLGHFIHKIGKAGQGPGEYTDIADSSVDFVRKEIYLYDYYENKVHKYDIKTGNFIGSISLEVDNPKSFFIQYLDGRIYASAVPYPQNKESFLLQEFDAVSGERIGSFLKASDYNKGWNYLRYTQNGGFYYPNENGNFKYAQMFMDTIISLEKGIAKPFLVVKAKNWITSDDIDGLIEAEDKNDSELFDQILYRRNISYGICEYFEVGNIVGFQYRNDRDMSFVIYNKKENTVRITDCFHDDLLYSGYRELFLPIVFADSKGVYSCIQPEAMSRFLDIGYSGGFQPGLEKLKELSEESNPVLFYYEYK